MDIQRWTDREGHGEKERKTGRQRQTKREIDRERVLIFIQLTNNNKTLA